MGTSIGAKKALKTKKKNKVNSMRKLSDREKFLEQFKPTGKANLFINDKGKLARILKYKDEYYYEWVHPSINNAGYEQCSAGLVHALVAKVFLGKKPKDHDIDHIDKVRTNNRVENLRYIPKSENRVTAQAGRKHQNFGKYIIKSETLFIPGEKPQKMTPMEYYEYLKIVNPQGASKFKNKINKKGGEI